MRGQELTVNPFFGFVGNMSNVKCFLEARVTRPLPHICRWFGSFQMSSEREVKYSISLIPSTAPIPIMPYKIALTELRDFEVQLQDSLQRGFIRPTTSSWGAFIFVC